MKKKCGSTFEYEAERNADLVRAYREQIARLYEEKDSTNLDEVFTRTASAPARRFYVTPERAAIVVQQIHKGLSIASMRPPRREMFMEIYSRVRALRQEKPQWSLARLCTAVVQQPAPSFYLTPKSVKVIIYKIKRGWYEERKRKLRHLF